MTRKSAAAKKPRVAGRVTPEYSEIDAALHELEQLAAPLYTRQQIETLTKRIRAATDALQRRDFDSPYFRDAYPLAILRIQDEMTKSHAAEKTNKKRWANKKPRDRTAAHPRTEEAIQLLQQQKAIFPKDSLSAFHAVAKVMGISMSKLEKEILTPARKLDLLTDYRKLPPL